MVKYESRYTEAALQRRGEAYDEAISNEFELMIWEIEKYFLKKILAEYPDSAKRIRYLDFACGSGRIISFLGQYVEHRTGIDISENMLEAAKRKIPARFVIGNIVEDATLLHGEEFDLITSFRLFLNLENKNRYLILKALRRYLADDGYLVVNNHMNRYSILGITALLIKALKIYPSMAEADEGQRAIIGTMSELEFKRILAECGYEVEKVYRFVFFPGHNSLMVLPRRFLVPVEIFLSRVPLLNLLCKDQIYVCRKQSRV